MGIAVKNSGIKLDNTIKRGNLALGINNIEYGPSQTTGYYSGMSIPTNGYVLYETNSGGRLRMYRAQNDAEFINIVNKLGGNVITIDEALTFVASNTNFLPLDKPISNITTDGLVLYYDASLVSSYPKSGATIYDLSGNDINGELLNAPTFNINGAIVFDGVDDNVNCNNNSNPLLNPSPSEAWSLSATFKNSQPLPNDNAIYGIAGKRVGNDTNGYTLMLRGGIYKGVLARLSTSGQSLVDIIPITNYSNILSNGNYHQMVMTYGTNDIGSLYIDGVLVGQSMASNFNFNNTSSAFKIGVGDTNNNHPFNGSINSVLFYNKALTEYEIYQNYITTLDANIVTDGKSLIQNWSNLGSLTARTSNALIAPDGTRSATLFERISINLTGHAQIRQALPVVDLLPSTSYDVSFWAKRVSLTQRLDFEFSDSPQQVITLTDDWKFYSFSLTTNSTFPVGEFIDIGSTTTAAGSVLNERYSIWNLHVSISKT